MKIELPAEAGENVISIEVSEKYRYSEGYCDHWSVELDEELAELTCRKCNQKLAAVAWIARLANEWHRIRRMDATHQAATKLYEEKIRCKCQHCGRMTLINPPSQFERKLREARAKAEQESLRDQG
jgi:hypothetical protein